jgi:hypothetical protein
VQKVIVEQVRPNNADFYQDNYNNNSIGTATGIVVDGKAIYADAIILNVPLDEIPRLVPEGYLEEPLKDLLQNLETSASITMDITSNNEMIRGKNDTIVSLQPLAILSSNKI